VAYRRKQLSPYLQPVHWLRRGYALWSQAWQRVNTARGLRTADFTMRGHEAIDGSISPRSFLDLCLRENAARLGRYDGRLLRPVIVPAIARVLRTLLPR
jgi:hypothetical protein